MTTESVLDELKLVGVIDSDEDEASSNDDAVESRELAQLVVKARALSGDELAKLKQLVEGFDRSVKFLVEASATLRSLVKTVEGLAEAMKNLEAGSEDAEVEIEDSEEDSSGVDDDDDSDFAAWTISGGSR